MKKRPVFPTRVVWVAILGAIGTSFCIYGSALLSGQVFVGGWICIFIGLTCGCIAGRLWIINYRTKHQMPGWLDSTWMLLASISVCAISCFLAYVFMPRQGQNQTPEKSPDLVLSFVDLNSPEKTLELTNNLLYKLSDPKPHVFFPVPDPSDFIWNIGIKNNGNATADDIELTVAFPWFFVGKAEGRWNRTTTLRTFIAESETGQMVTGRFNLREYRPESLLDGSAMVLPPLHFSNIDLMENPKIMPICPCMFTIKAKDYPEKTIAFSAVFIPTTFNPPQWGPVVLPWKIPTNSLREECPPQIWNEIKLWNESSAQRQATPDKKPTPTTKTLLPQIQRFARIAAAKSWKPPEFPQVAGGVLLHIGGNNLTFTRDILISGAALKNTHGVIAAPFLADNRIYISAELYSGVPNSIVKINDEWPPSLPEGWDRNFNANSIEIVDNSTNPVFQLRYMSATEIEINGVFVTQDGGIEISYDDGVRLASPGVPISDTDLRTIKPWFKYPSSEHLGQTNQ